MGKRAQQKNSAERDAARADLLGTLARRAAGPGNDCAGAVIAGDMVKNEPAGVVQPSPALAERFTVDVVARQLGVPVAAVKAFVRSADTPIGPDDFRIVLGVEVFTASGIDKIRHALEDQMQAERSPSPSEKKLPVDAGADGAEDLTLTRVFRWSKRVLADRPNGLEVVLEVKSAKNLQPGMVLKACRPGEFCWFYEGRLPRTLGERQLFFPSRA